MVNCQGCGEETLSRLCCPKCSEHGRTSFFCSQDCFVSSWPSHSKLHTIIRQAALSTITTSSYGDACASESLSTEDALAASPATTAASHSEERFLHKKTHPVNSSVYAEGRRTTRSRALSPAGSETELPVVSSSISTSYSSSSSRVSAAPLPGASHSSIARIPPALARTDQAGAAQAAVARKHGEGGDEEDFAAGGVLTAVRSLLLPNVRDKTGRKTHGNCPPPAAAIVATAAAARVTEAVRAVFSTQHCSRNNVITGSGSGDSRKKKESVVAGVRREALISGSGGGTAATAGVPPHGVGACRCVTLALIFMFSMFFIWMMRRALFDGTGSTSAYYTAHTDEVTPNRSEASSDSNDMISAVLARIGARPYGEEISALQASVQDIRNELSAVTTLVQHHKAVIDQFVEKPNLSGRRQGGGGAINQAISAFLEGGPPLPDAPPLKLPLVASSTAAAAGGKEATGGGLSEPLQQDAVASRHSALRRAKEGAPVLGSAAHTDEVEGVLSQRYYGASVTAEGSLAEQPSRTGQATFSDGGPRQPAQGSSPHQQASGKVGAAWPSRAAANSSYLDGFLLEAEVKDASRLNSQGDGGQEGNTTPNNGSSNVTEAAGKIASTYTKGNIEHSKKSVKRLDTVERKGKLANLSINAAGEARSTPAYAHAPYLEGDGEEDLLRRNVRGGEPFRTSVKEKGQEEEAEGVKREANTSSRQYGMPLRRLFNRWRDNE